MAQFLNLSTIEKYTKPAKPMTMLDAIKSLIAKDGMTINQVVNSQWIKFSFEKMGWKMQCNNTITRMLHDQANLVIIKLKEQIQAEISSDVRYSVVMDEWTSIANDRFMSVVLRNSKTSYNLGVALLKGSSTSDALKKTLDDHLKLFGISIEKHVIAIVSDGAAVMKKMQRELPSAQQICLSHGVHLAVTDTFVSKKRASDDDEEFVLLKSKFEESISCMNKVINSFQHSGLLYDSLAAYQRADGMTELVPLTWCKTRWNSLLDSIERFLVIEPQLAKTIVDYNLRQNAQRITMPTQDQILILEQVKDILKPVSIGTTKLLENMMTLEKGVKTIEFIEESLAMVQESPIKTKFIENLNKRMDARINFELLNLTQGLQQADLLKPAIIEYGISMYERLFDEEFQEDVCEIVEGQPTGDLKAKLQKKLDQSSKRTKKSTNFKDSLAIFLQTGHKTNELIKLENALESIPPTSVASERVFSFCGNTITRRRAKMSAELLNSLVLLNSFE